MRKEFRETTAIIRRNRFFLISFHKNPDGDALANALLWASLLKRLGKQYRIIMSEGFPDAYSFMKERYSELVVRGLLQVQPSADFSRVLPKRFVSAPLLMLDSSDISRAGPLAGQLSDRSVIINFDHHEDNAYFGTVNCVDPKAAAVSEIFVRYLKQTGKKPDHVMNELIYISLYSDTGGFTQRNMTRKTLQLLRELIGKKVDIRVLNTALQKRSLGKSMLIGRILSRLESSFNGKLVWSKVRRSDLAECGVRPYETDGLIEEIVRIQDSRVVILFKETDLGVVKVSLRSKSGIDVRVILKKFGGGGHQAAAGAEIRGSLDSVVKKVIAEIRSMAGSELRK